jgi:hypothetical protein
MGIGFGFIVLVKGWVYEEQNYSSLMCRPIILLLCI